MKRLTPRKLRLIELLSDGHRYSVVDIVKRLPIGDPRSDIRDLRNSGINVEDEWHKCSEGRYKRYFIRN